jgi:type IV secretory pathway VirB4 component
MATTKENESKPTQDFVPIKEVRDGVVILKDGSMRAVLLASSINFALKSQEEQQSVLYQFQNFLNSINFSIQIFVQSRRLDISPYINLLEDRIKFQSSELMKVQTREYMDFIRNLTESVNIMTKSFFVVIPYSPTIIGKKNGVFSGIFGGKKDKKESDNNEYLQFEEYKSQLQQRVSVVEQGLVRCGVRVAQLGTEEMIEFFYKLFNPGTVEKPINMSE